MKKVANLLAILCIIGVSYIILHLVTTEASAQVAKHGSQVDRFQLVPAEYHARNTKTATVAVLKSVLRIDTATGKAWRLDHSDKGVRWSAISE